MKNILQLLTGLFLFGWANISYAQCNAPSNVLGNDTVICEGDSLTLISGNSFISHQWSNGSTDSSITIGVAGMYSYQSYFMSGQNLILNGDFEMGDTLFSTAYTYGASTSSTGILYNASTYAISTNAVLTHSGFASCNDHTSGTGNYMIVNGSSVINTNVWEQTIAVTPNTQYAFSGWFNTIVSTSPGQLEFTINGLPIGPIFILPSTTCDWVQYYDLWTSGPTQTSITISITSQNTAGNGNDFAIDDLRFEEVCPVNDTINVAMAYYPEVDLGNDTVICPGNTLNLDVTDSSFYTYAWSDGTVGALNSQSSTDSLLWVAISSSTCTTYDTMIVTVSPQPVVDLGPDSLYCPGDVIPIYSYWPSANYLWSDGSTNDTLNVFQAGNYWVEVTDNCGTSSDSVYVDYVPFPLAELGNDTAICSGETFTLSANPGLDSYLWSSASQTQTTQVNNAGLYWVAASLNGCVDRDSIIVTFLPSPTVNLGNDTTICQGQNILLDASNNNASYLWSNGSTNQVFFVVLGGEYSVTATINGCEDSDTININVLPLPISDLGNDTSLCDGDTYVLSAYSPGASFVWNDTSTDSLFTVTSPGTYSVQVTNNCGTITETVNIDYNPIPQPSLEEQYTICPEDSVKLEAGVNNATYLWSNSSVSNSVFAAASGEIWVAVTQNNCTGYDTALINVVQMPNANLGGDTIICFGESLFYDFSDANVKVLWENATTNNERSITIPGYYWVELTKEECVLSDSIMVTIENCDLTVEMPNIFTPNGDGENDVFTPIVNAGVISGTLTVFNRWGQQVYQTTDTKFEWNGQNKNGITVADGVYFYTVSINGELNAHQEISGTVTVTGSK